MMIFRLTAIALVCVLTGCSLLRPESPSVHHYNIPTPAKIQQDAPDKSSADVRIDLFNMLGPYSEQMVLQKNRSELHAFSLHRWVQSPEFLVREYFYELFMASQSFENVFASSAASTDFIVQGNIRDFSFGPDHNARLKMTVLVRDATNGEIVFSDSYNEEEEMESGAPSALPLAMRSCLKRVGVDLINKICAHAQSDE